MDDERTEHGNVQDPDTNMHLSYTMRCRRDGRGWSCRVTFDDGQRKFAPLGSTYFDQLSIVPDVVARAALVSFKRGR